MFTRKKITSVKPIILKIAKFKEVYNHSNQIERKIKISRKLSYDDLKNKFETYKPDKHQIKHGVVYFSRKDKEGRKAIFLGVHNNNFFEVQFVFSEKVDYYFLEYSKKLIVKIRTKERENSIENIIIVDLIKGKAKVLLKKEGIFYYAKPYMGNLLLRAMKGSSIYQVNLENMKTTTTYPKLNNLKKSIIEGDILYGYLFNSEKKSQLIKYNLKERKQIWCINLKNQTYLKPKLESINGFLKLGKLISKKTTGVTYKIIDTDSLIFVNKNDMLVIVENNKDAQKIVMGKFKQGKVDQRNNITAYRIEKRKNSKYFLVGDFLCEVIDSNIHFYNENLKKVPSFLTPDNKLKFMFCIPNNELFNSNNATGLINKELFIGVFKKDDKSLLVNIIDPRIEKSFKIKINKDQFNTEASLKKRLIVSFENQKMYFLNLNSSVSIYSLPEGEIEQQVLINCVVDENSSLERVRKNTFIVSANNKQGQHKLIYINTDYEKKNYRERIRGDLYDNTDPDTNKGYCSESESDPDDFSEILKDIELFQESEPGSNPKKSLSFVSESDPDDFSEILKDIELFQESEPGSNPKKSLSFVSESDPDDFSEILEPEEQPPASGSRSGRIKKVLRKIATKVKKVLRREDSVYKISNKEDYDFDDFFDSSDEEFNY
ncbi:hypothetical protein ACFLZV_02060 [Candidatus Margulisiibacteriota bacterium]